MVIFYRPGYSFMTYSLPLKDIMSFTHFPNGKSGLQLFQLR